MDFISLPIIIVLIVLLVVFVRASIKVVPEYERGVIFRLGRVGGARGPQRRRNCRNQEAWYWTSLLRRLTFDGPVQYTHEASLGPGDGKLYR